MRDRTADLLRARQALSQLSYSPFLGHMLAIFALNQGNQGAFDRRLAR